MATGRLRRESLASYTTPMPPLPSWLTIEYGPRVVPGVRDIGGAIVAPDLSGALL